MELPVRTMLRLSLPTAVVLGALALAWAPDVHAGRKKARKARGDRPRVTGTVEFELLAHDLEDASPAPMIGAGLAWLLGSHSPNPAWSPDGRRIAYHDGYCVTVRTADGRRDGVFRPPPGMDSWEAESACRGPSWSHNGKQVVTGSAFYGPTLVFQAGKAGSAIGGPDAGMWGVTFSSDDRWLVGRSPQGGVAAVSMTNPTGLVPVASGPDQTMDGYFPALSPDGRHLARLRTWGDAELEVLAIDLDAPQRVPVGDNWGGPDVPGMVGQPKARLAGLSMEFEWSSDGQQLVAVTNTQWYGGYDDYAYPPGDLVVLHVGRGMVQPLGVRGTNPTWSPDGRFIAFEREGHQGIWVVSSRGGPPWQLHPTGIEPRWSPAGNRLLILDPVAGVGRILKLG